MKTKVEFVKAEVSDFETIQRLAYEIWPVCYSAIISMDQIEYMLRLLYAPSALANEAENGQNFFFMLENKVPIGFLGITRKEKNRLKLDKLYLSESHRGKGYGKEMMAFVEREAKRLEAKFLFLNVNRFNHTLDFYKKMGFEIELNLDIPFGPFWLNDFVMVKKLDF